MKKSKFILLIMLTPLLALTLHKYYISLTKIDFIKEKRSVQITMRFFIDDVESTLENRYETKLELATENENKKADILFEKYISQKFRIRINDEFKNFLFLGKEYENDLVFFYLEIANIEKITNIEIQNTMLFEDFPEQENYIKTKINEIKKTIVLIKENDKEMLKY